MWTNGKLVNGMKRFAAAIEEEKVYLNELDSAIGDGDHGTNMARGTAEMVARIEDVSSETAPETLKAAAMAIISKTGGASGPLYGSAFLAMAEQAAETPDEPGLIMKAGLAGLKKRGKAEAGEKTMIDVWTPAVEAVQAGRVSAEQIHSFAEATKKIKATKGRASYLGDRSIGHMDPGAASSSCLFQAFIKEGLFHG